MFQQNGKTYDCPYCHNQGENSCSRGCEVGVPALITIQLEGTTITADYNIAIQQGDTYIAKRNTGWKLLTCAFVDTRHWIESKENEYSYDTWECAKVLSLE